jgi:hypothetical protein
MIMTSTAETADTMPAPSAQQHPDADILACAARWHAAFAASDAEIERLTKIRLDADAMIAELQPATMPGAAAQLRQVLGSMEVQLGTPDEWVSPGERCWLESKRNVLGFLEAAA